MLEEYEAFLHEKDLVDENGYLALLPEKIRAGALDGANVFFFGFPSFTAQAREGVRAAAERAASVTGIFLAGRDEFYTNEGARVFKEVLSEYGEFVTVMKKSTQCSEALKLSGMLFSPEKFASAPESSDKIQYLHAADETR